MEPKPNNANNPYGFPEGVDIDLQVVLTKEQAEAEPKAVRVFKISISH